MADKDKTPAAETSGTNFIHNTIDSDLADGKYPHGICTRFPPEPNGYLHIGHSRAICVNFDIKAKYNGRCNLRFDDTNPAAEDIEYIRAIKEDIQWLGFEWDELCHSSHYFDQLYEYALMLVKKGKAYVCSLNEEEIREYRGNLTTPGKDSPYRERSVEENLQMFEDMKSGKYGDGEHVLRAKIDMSSGNMNLRDPLLYRIRHIEHPVVGNKWCVYPLYDFTHGQSDAIEGITHSLCSLEFQDHRPLYDWFLEQLEIESPPKQMEFAKLFISHVVVSKRRLKQLVEENLVDGWDDPRMPTLSGMRRRGFTPESIRHFNQQLGVSKGHSLIDYGLLEESLRQDLNAKAHRRMVVLDPLKITLTNYDQVEMLQAPNHPQQEDAGTRAVPMAQHLYIERSDFMEEAPKKYFRLKPEGEVRLRNSYVIKCEEVIKDASGEVVELKCSVDTNTLGKNPEGRKVKGIVHWVSAEHAHKIEVRLYDRLFTDENPTSHKDKDFKEFMNSESLKIIPECFAEPSLANAKNGDTFQFERLGYFTVDSKQESSNMIFNRAVTLRDTWK